MGKVKTLKGGLTPIQRRAAALLATGVTSREVATTLHVAEDTVSRWKRVAGFMLAIDDTNREETEIVRQRMRAMGQAATDAVFDVLSDATADPHARLKAAAMVLDRMGVGAATKVEVSGPGGRPIVVADATPVALLAELGALLGIGQVRRVADEEDPP